MKKILITLAISILFTGCVAKNPLKINSEADLSANSQIEKVDKDALLHQDNIKLPDNYDVKSFSRVRVAAYLDKLDWEKDARKTNLDKGIIAKLLENELARTKRFDVLSRNFASGDFEAAFQIDNTVEAGAIKQGEKLNPDFILEASVSLGTVVKEKFDHYEIIFRSLVTTKLIDPNTNQIIESFEPIRFNLPAKNFFMIEDKFMGGFNLNKQNELQEAYKEAAQKSIQVLVNRVMNYYPTGGRLTNMRGNRFGIDAGINQGFASKSGVILFLSDDGLDIPIASAEVTPARNSGSGTIMTWLTDDPEVVKIKKKMESLGKEYLKRNKVYAVSVGMPEDWKL
ncbi:penicillin-binding protein activator LpoB [Pelagibaculum spongiae]|uniref:Penicillin-binding protein activator LpoB n=1 Tax=Pelagibaculum spongiae TaxID=2080658 RepID=A0A2V1H4U0_9GAMM|nr:penicillin-binding protein activator LpoB [Pelagibaculum spongiae]PVZ70656.1 penicillin-binding protein activator LpoB [Pelagibaculum spongiae]